MDWTHWTAIAIFASYFLIIIFLFARILSDLASAARNARHARSPRWKAALFVGLALASFAHTWFYMFQFLRWSYLDHASSVEHNASGLTLERMADWVVNTELFEQAWAAVCEKPLGWWWSEQLCIFTAGPWTAFLLLEGRKHKVKHVWAYMLLGQAVAISVASNLFYLALILSAPDHLDRTRSATQRPRAPLILWACSLASLVTVARAPPPSSPDFLKNLLTMHALLIVPFLPAPFLGSSIDGPSALGAPARWLYAIFGLAAPARWLYAIFGLAALALRVRAWLEVSALLDWRHVVPALAKTLHAHPAQSSIGWDVVWTSLSLLVWAAARPGARGTVRNLGNWMGEVVATLGISVGTVSPLVYLAETAGDAGSQPKDE